MKPTLYIYRGLPGSGKSTQAKKLNCLVIEPADNLSTIGGEYVWTSKLSKEQILEFAKEQIDLAKKYRYDIAVAEVLPAIEDVLFFFDIYENYFNIVVKDMPNLTFEESLERNVHEVGEEDILRMIDEWEDWK